MHIHGRVAMSLAGTALLWALAAPANGAEDTAGRVADAAAIKSIERMSEFLAGAKQFSVTIDSAYDVVQEWGQKVEFGETRAVTVSRPDRLRIDTTSRDGSKSGVVFDGKNITAFDLQDKVYATTTQPGSVDETTTHFVDDLGVRMPMAPILQGRMARDAKEWAREVRYIEVATIGDVPCDHVALHGDWEDVQLWIARGDQPLLQRMVITYHRAEGKPQYTAQLSNWNLTPNTEVAVFAFTPQPEAAKIAFRRRAAAPAAPGAKP